MLEELKQEKLECTGCGACVNVCPADAMRMVPDALGFLEPIVLEDKCIHCGLCLSICPVLSQRKSENSATPKCFAAMMPEQERKRSSSGAIYPALARKFVQNGNSAYGVVWSEDFLPCVEEATDLEAVERQRKSKYVQADTGMTFLEIKNKLKKGQTILFSGCPCQVAGLKACLGREEKNLYTIDIFCHGTPSIKMLKEELQQKVGDEQLKSIDFRTKNRGWGESSKWLVLETADGKVQEFSMSNSAYEKGFHKGLTLRESCYDCPFCDFPRQGDLSLGDFWGIKDRCAELDDDAGTSVILVNSEKGKQLLEEIRSEISVLKEVPLEWLKDNRIHPKRAAHECQPYFRFLMEQGVPFEKAVETALAYRFNIGIVGPWMNINHGGALTYYALYETLRDMGHNPTMISQPEGLEWSPDPQYCRFKELPYPKYAIAPVKAGYAQQKAFNDSCDMFIVGSDQLFTGQMLQLLDGYADLQWVNSDKKMIAYSASFARDHFSGTDQQRKKLQYFLKRFDAFSVREKSGVALAREEFGIDAQWMLDPVFLCDIKHFDNLAKKGMERVPAEPYVFGYVLDPNKGKEKAIKSLAETMHCGCHAVTDVGANPDAIKHVWNIQTLKEVQNEELIAHIKNSKFVITDSFHGVCFAILMKKEFIAIVNAERGASRFYSLLELFHLEDRLVATPEEVPEKVASLKRIDYGAVEILLQAERKRCREWLEKAIAQPKTEKTFSDYDASCAYTDRLQVVLEKRLKWNRDCLDGRIDWHIGHVEEIKNSLQDTDVKQWEQLEDHRLRLDGVDDTNKNQWQQLEDHRLRLDGVEDTNKNQWQQLEDHRLRMDGSDAQIKELQQQIEVLSKIVDEQSKTIEAMRRVLKLPLKIDHMLKR